MGSGPRLKKREQGAFLSCSVAWFGNACLVILELEIPFTRSHSQQRGDQLSPPDDCIYHPLPAYIYLLILSAFESYFEVT